MSLLLGCVSLTGIECPTFSKLQFKVDPCLNVSSSCIRLVSSEKLDSNSIFTKIGLAYYEDLLQVTVVLVLCRAFSLRDN